MIKWIWNDEWYISKIDDIDVSHGIIYDWGMMLLRIYFHDFMMIQTASKKLFERDRSNSGNAKWYSGISEHEANSNPAWPKKQNQSSSTFQTSKLRGISLNHARVLWGVSIPLLFWREFLPQFSLRAWLQWWEKKKRSDDGDWFIDRLFVWPRRQA